MSEVSEIQERLKKVREFIDSRYAPYLKKDPITGDYPMCKNINLYLSDKETIINDLEMQLKSNNSKETSYEDIGKKLDKHFITDDYWEVKTLSELEKELGIEEE